MRQLFYFSGLVLALALFTFSACDDDDVIITPLSCEDLTAELKFVVPDSFLEVILTNGTPPFDYKWHDGSTKSYLQPPEEMNSVTVTDATGCTVVATLDPPSNCGRFFSSGSLTESTTVPNTFEYSIFAFGEDAPFSYAWSTGETDTVITITEAGHYEVTITSAGGCTIGADVSMNNGPDGLCELTARMRERDDRLSVSLSRGAVGTTYFWSDGSTEQYILNPLPDTPYSVTITHPDGCSTIVQRRL
ncbi:MAG: hypothetical protein AAFN81_16750 [Bacteroidota bacterium]